MRFFEKTSNEKYRDVKEVRFLENTGEAKGFIRDAFSKLKYKLPVIDYAKVAPIALGVGALATGAYLENKKRKQNGNR